MMKRERAIAVFILALPICVGATASISAVSTLALDDEADRAPQGAPLPSTRNEPAPVAQVTAPPAAPAAPRALSANPLWGMPLSQFSVTRERPIFSPSRRPPPPAVAPAATARIVVPPKPKGPERPQLSLVGTVASEEEGFGIFLDQSSKDVLRLKVGEEFQGWKLKSVQGRESTLAKDDQVVVLALPEPGLGQPSATPVRNEAGPTTPDSARPLSAAPRRR